MSEYLNAPIPRQRGFTLIESIIVIVVMAIAVTGIIAMNAHIFTGQKENEDTQVGVALLQECAEQVLARRRASGYADVVTNAATICSTMGNVGGFGVPSVTLGAEYTGGNCPSTRNCRIATISITKTGFGTLNPLAVLLVEY